MLYKMKNDRCYHTAIIGAGASGLFCAGSFDAPKIVLETNAKPALKVTVSGGGKCNFSNRFISAANYESRNKHFCKNALAAFKPTDFTALLDEEHVPWEERANGQLFAKHAKDIVHFLVKRARAHHSEIALGVRVLSIKKDTTGFVLVTSSGPVRAQHVVLATGGVSFPALGGNSFAGKLARQFGLNFIEQRPVLCGLTFPKNLRPLCLQLAGNSLPVVIRQNKHVFEGDLLFTHDGISGPAVLQLSLFWQPENPVEIDFLPHQNAAEILAAHKNSTQGLSSVFNLPHKLAKTLLANCDGPLDSATREQLRTAVQTLHHFSFTATNTAGYTKAEATAGGIDTREINPSTLAIRRVPGFFVTGEALDVTGNLGGYNLHWAWASGFSAAQALKKCF